MSEDKETSLRAYCCTGAPVIHSDRLFSDCLYGRIFLFKFLGWRLIENWAMPLLGLVILGQSVQGTISGFDEVAPQPSASLRLSVTGYESGP
ncbi:hypothetical protein GGQ85_004349 [Nitrobacter vulgaris]|uniref:hypothetical protein n=1 Tax=Nitrobacter vulgaris TaxID=29421 RepID=UPI00285BF4F7|nr:hypothetical protein [Nitrobacter vulgaris]MDR6306615.1 hypothetical protein [Nitrobacter vulgaris]